LIGNALKFTPAGGAVEVSARARRGEVAFEVSDTGSGISREDLARVFDRYWKADRPGTKGVGLGLYIAKGIVEAHGGRIWVESAVGAGTSFGFELPEGTPLRHGEEPPAYEPPTPLEPANARLHPGL
jgi:signal transduction histidine kinase